MRDLSDHCPIWIKFDSLDWGPKPFKFLSCWVKHDDFYSFTEKSWNEIHVCGKTIFCFKEKLEFLRAALRNWNREVFGILNLEVEVARKDFNSLDDLAFDGSLVDLEELALRRSVASSKMWETLNFKESILRQKARVLWMEEGNSNSKFFHKMVNIRIRRNSFLGLNTPRGWIDRVDLVKEEIMNHFQSRFAEPLAF
ncbi:uncharacterized protein LOC131649625 [Vicia villosa]|uniref:uncharacterized protein LOC131649625 n=1 Tax=Vicia villosa TaxID=3911 RepID=UPI00273ACBD5|nr:uncharacterized protein LOC131649625 [Vicia villosa]